MSRPLCVDTDLGEVPTRLDPQRVRGALQEVIASVDVRLDSTLAEDPETGWDTYRDLVDRFIHGYERPRSGGLLRVSA